jgi:hypothetical protein
VFDVDMDEAEVKILEMPLALRGNRRWLWRVSVEAFRIEYAVDAVTIEVRQEMAQHESQVIQRETRRSSYSADDRAILLSSAP